MQVNATDFKDLQLGEAPQLEKVNESGEFKRRTITEGKEKHRIATYGKVVAITRQVIINAQRATALPPRAIRPGDGRR
jgi:hypothetical protein